MSYGCYNRKPFSQYFQAQDGWASNQRRMVPVLFQMSPDCRYTHSDLGQQDTECIGCEHKVDLKSPAGYDSGQRGDHET